MTGPELLARAAEVFADRRDQYGSATVLFDQVARRWSVTLGTEVTAAQVVLCMVDLKLARLAHDPAHRDSILDVAGYAACLAEVAQDGSGR